MLLIDNGNTRTKFAVYSDGKLCFEDKIVNSELSSAMTPAWLRKIADVRGARERCFGCSVGEKQSALFIEQRLQNYVGPITWLHTERHFGGIQNAYGDDYYRLGADRWFALVGYRNLARDNAVIIDAGTALTIDWLEASGNHLGGWIVPGRRLMQESMHNGTANLNEQLTEECYRQPATSTQQAMSYGAHYALVGAIAQALSASAELFANKPYSVVVTGGDGERLVKSLQTVQSINYCRIDDLVFKGLAVAADNLDN
ncbi:type III pantothenate kinase [Idiomarina seosinensis]|uniref:Type III pantothenate kinase n=1 Tax=Idiomarina seosinensis TaxID=281739 RepID=A0A432Z4E1_9GAMM|nr:type III pantothenate kinase [Idiomarina seosinensis]RUO72747.1 type III pantothenate kinase [Idiomarina seosinensis]